VQKILALDDIARAVIGHVSDHGLRDD